MSSLLLFFNVFILRDINLYFSVSKWKIPGSSAPPPPPAPAAPPTVPQPAPRGPPPPIVPKSQPPIPPKPKEQIVIALFDHEVSIFTSFLIYSLSYVNKYYFID